MSGPLPPGLTPAEQHGAAALAQWFEHSPGREFIQAECQRLRRAFATMFGYHLVQVGALGAGEYLQSSRIPHRVVVATEHEGGGAHGLMCTPGALPIASDTVDVVLLPHVLEFAEEPHGVLREAERVLIGEGHLVVLGFNPASLWGLGRVALGWRERAPWSGHYVSLHRLKDWMRLLGFDVVRTERFFFRPPLGRARMLERLRWLDQFGARAWPALGAGYMVIGRKRLVHLMPLKTQWRLRRLRAAGVVEPSTRTQAPGRAAAVAPAGARQGEPL